MKNLMVTVCVLALSAFAFLPATAKLGVMPAADETQHAYTSVGGTRAVETFIDYPTLERDGDTVKVWTLWVYYPEAGQGQDHPAYGLQNALIDCKAKTHVFTQFVEYAPDGAMLDSVGRPVSENSGAVVPGSMGEQVLNAACAGEYTQGGTFDTLPNAVTAARLALVSKGDLAKGQ